MGSPLLSAAAACAFLVLVASAESPIRGAKGPASPSATFSHLASGPFSPHRAFTFFSRATAPFEGLLRSCFLEDAGSIVACLKEKAILALERAAGMDTVTIGEGVSLVRRDPGLQGQEEEDWRSNGVEGIEDDVDTRLLKGLARVLRGRALRLSLPDNMLSVVHRGIEEGRVKKHKHLGTMITCIAVVLKTLALASIAFIAKKALLLGKISLLLSAAVMMKKLMGGGGGGGHSGTSYEVVSLHRRASHQRELPHHGEVAPGYGQGYGTGDGMDRDGLPFAGYALVRRSKASRRVGGVGTKGPDEDPRVAGLTSFPPREEWSIPQFQIEKGAS